MKRRISHFGWPVKPMRMNSVTVVRLFLAIDSMWTIGLITRINLKKIPQLKDRIFFSLVEVICNSGSTY
jgi:hypothetical protein